MARERSAPPGSPGGVAILIGHAEPRNGKMPPPGVRPGDGSPMGGKASAEEAGVVLDSEHCVDCKNYEMTSGNCLRVEGTYAPQDGCARYFEANGGDHSEPDADDTGEAPAISNTDQAA